MRVSKNWVKFNKMFTLSPWVHSVGLLRLELCCCQEHYYFLVHLGSLADYSVLW